MDALEQFFRVLLTAVGAVAFFWMSYCLALALPDRKHASIRLCSAQTIALWLLVAIFLLLSAVSAFRLWGALPLIVVGAVVAHAGVRRIEDPLATAAADLSRAREILESVVRGPGGVLAIVVAAVVALRLARGLVAPSLAWDDLTYHLLRAGRWVQAGGYAVEAAPNAWGYYEYFAPVGDLIWSWAMLGVHDDSLLGIANVWIWSTTVLGVYTLARLLGAREPASVLAAGVVGTIPAFLNYLVSGYADPVTLVLYVLAAVHAARAWLRASWADAVLASAALGLAVGAKVSNVAFALPFAVLLVGAIVRLPNARARVAALVGSVAATLPPMLFFVKAWIDTGSPTYPIPVVVGGRIIFAGDAAQQEIFSRPPSPGLDDSWWHLVEILFVPGSTDLFERGQFMSLGPGLLLLVIPAVLGGVRLFGRPGRRAVCAALVASAVFVVASVLPEDVVNLRTVFGWSLGRFLLAPVVVVAVLAGMVEERWAIVLAGLAVGINVLLAIPLGWGPPDLEAAERLAPTLLPAIGVGAVVVWLLWRRNRVVGAVAALVVICIALTTIAMVRRDVRYEYYRAAASGDVWSVNRDVATLAERLPLWSQLDRREPTRLAVVAGWPGMSPVGARYPLLGRRLQNRVVYVPITRDGSVSMRPEAYTSLEAGDARAWIERLVAERIDYVVALPPVSIERVWAERNPRIFVPAGPLKDEESAIFRFDRGEAERLLEGR